MSPTPILPDNVVAYYKNGILPRGIRNNNPGNVRLGDQWQGLCSVQQDKSFCQFSEAKFGIRSTAYILRISYFQRYALATVKGIITRWAPASENNTQAYINAVCQKLGVDAEDRIDLRSDSLLTDLLSAVFNHENGSQPYTSDQILAGIKII